MEISQKYMIRMMFMEIVGKARQICLYLNHIL